MSEDAPKQPEPVKSEAQTPTPQRANASQTTAPQDLISYSSQQTRARSQPFLKVLGIKTLKGTIGLLEGVVEKLEAEPLELRRDIASQVSTPTGELPPVAVAIPQTQASGEVVSASPALDAADAADFDLEEDVTDSLPATETTRLKVASVAAQPAVSAATPSIQERLRLLALRFQSWWQAALPKIRSFLPASVNQKLPDWGLTTAIATLVIFLLWAPFALVQEKPAPVPVPVAESPPAPTIEPSPEPAIETPAELVAPESPAPVEIAPPPEPVLTPEQNLIAGIQNQVAQITSQYADGLIQSIQANFQVSFLIVKVSDGWYNLDESKQNKLANDMLSRSQELDFSKLEIKDSQGTVVARSPVVGSNMIILKRRIAAVT